VTIFSSYTANFRMMYVGHTAGWDLRLTVPRTCHSCGHPLYSRRLQTRTASMRQQSTECYYITAFTFLYKLLTSKKTLYTN